MTDSGFGGQGVEGTVVQQPSVGSLSEFPLPVFTRTSSAGMTEEVRWVRSSGEWSVSEEVRDASRRESEGVPDTAAISYQLMAHSSWLLMSGG